MKNYDHKKIERKWQAYWAKKGIYKTVEVGIKAKQYVLDMFPYPSGEGLHVGHPKGYIATDVYSRMSRMQGKIVLHPMGWDAFGLPAENYAIKNKIHPRKAVERNIKRFKEQLKMIGLDYDWDREINTTDPAFYKWTQWIFLKLYEKGLAYESYEPINWCPSCQTGLANEDLDGNACERCGTTVEKKPMRQWILKITAYADRLLEDLSLLPDWQEHIKESQRNWIGKSEGAEIDFPLDLNDGVKRVVLLHGKGGSATGGPKLWLKEKLEKLGLEVQIPSMPNTDTPDASEQADYVQQNCTLDEHTVIVGHSFGGLVILRLLERGIKVKRAAFVATPFSITYIDGKPRPTVASEFKKGFDFATIKKNAEFVLLYDTNDSIVQMSDGEKLAHELGGYLIKGVARKNHYNGHQEPDVFSVCVPAIRVFTTRPDTLFGATYMVLSPEHPWVMRAIDPRHNVLKNKKDVAAYVATAAKKTEIERQENKDKTGVILEGVQAINPADGEKIPVYVADYVLANYGTGAIMAVPAHDERDFEFAQKFNIPIKQVVAPIYESTVPGQKPRSDLPIDSMRDAVMCIVKHWDRDEYLCQQWREFDVRSLPSGGIEVGEDIVETGKREIVEETGYTGAKFVRQLGGFSYVHFYHQIKKSNMLARFRYLYFELKDGEQITVSAEEDAKHANVWKKKEDVRDFLNITEAGQIWNRFAEMTEDTPFVGEGYVVNSGEFDGTSTADAKQKITDKYGQKKTTYKLRDWVFSRQRYWGEPIPMIHCPTDGLVPVPQKDLPVKLPEVKKYEPTGTGESPLAAIDKWVNVKCPKCGGRAKRETNTMPQWAGSSWYYLRYMDPNNKKALVDKKKEKFWSPVDLYVGGAEHATRHLIYARFWHKFLFDIGAVATSEPFKRLISVGLIQAEDGRKMSKRFGNVINPDDIIKMYGADSLRVYEMFMGPFTDAIAWNTNSMIGARRFLERVWRLKEKSKIKSPTSDGVEKLLHRTIKKVGEDIQNFKFNTAISTMMIFVNAAEKEGIPRKQLLTFTKLLAPFAPHIAEDIWNEIGGKGSVHRSSWPTYDDQYLHDTTVTIMIQVNGRLRGQFEASATISEADARDEAEKTVPQWIAGKRIIKVIFVPGRLVNFVVA
jgi:leucyl-tRNA synthetase